MRAVQCYTSKSAPSACVSTKGILRYAGEEPQNLKDQSMTASRLPALAASRFYQHWLNADPDRSRRVASLAALSLAEADFAGLLQKETDAGLPLPRAMRRVRNLLIAVIIERDLGGRADLAEIVAAMSAFADFAIKTHLRAVMADMVAAHGAPIGEETGSPQELIVLGMGKLGGGELNVSSDIDLIFAYAEDGETRAGEGQRQLSNHEFFVRLGQRLIGALSEIIEDGFVFRVDMALRPNGASGPLVASLAMIEEYLIVQGREWERYAWVKARAITGRLEDIAELDKIVRPFVFRRYLDFGVIDAIRTMHAQIRAEVTRQEKLHPERSNNIKLGRGGIREIEFLAQSFQLIRGGRDAALRDRSTRTTLRILAEKELLATEVVERLLQSYTFLRNLEHRLQYLDDAQTHMLPSSEADQRIIALAMGFADAAALMAEIAAHRQYVATQFDAIFSDKGETQPARAEAAMDLQAMISQTDADRREVIESHMAAAGFDQPAEGARRILAMWQMPRIKALPEASRERLAALCHAALPLIVETGRPHQATLSRLMDFFEAIARRSSYLSLLTEYPKTLERVIRMMHSSGWAAQFLTQHPILLDELLNDLLLKTIPDWQELAEELGRQLAELQGDTERQMDLLREAHHAHQFHLLAYDLQGWLTMERLADHLSALADVIVAATLQAAWLALTSRHRDVPKFAVIAYGKLGGKELGYASDLDLIFLYDDDHPDAPMLYARLAQRFITWMTSHTSAGILFDVDTALRPDGASGLLVSSVEAFAHYQKHSAWSWEHQALTRARFCAGDAEIGARFERIREEVLRQPRESAKLRQDVVAMRRKMRDAHPNRTNQFDLKQDVGGMIDIEFVVQYLVLLHSAQYPQLTGNLGNIALLRMSDELGLIPTGSGIAAGDAYREMRRLQHAARLQGSEEQVAFDEIAPHAAAAKRLWEAVLGEA